MPSTPRVSVIVALYRSVEYLGDVVASVQAQTMSDWELILVDDASPDNTFAVASELAATDPRIRVFRHEKNMGAPAATRNTGLKEARGEWVTFLDHDDSFKPTKLERLLAAAEQQGVSFICSNIELLNAGTGKVDGQAWGEVTGDVTAGFAKRLLEGNFVPPNSTLIKKEVIDKVGMFDTGLKGVDDYDLWYRIARAYPCGVLNEVLATWRYLNEASISADDEKMLADEQRFYRKVAAAATEDWERELATAGEKRAQFRLANRALLHTDYKAAAKLYSEAGKGTYAWLTRSFGPLFRLAYLARRKRSEHHRFAPLNLHFTA